MVCDGLLGQDETPRRGVFRLIVESNEGIEGNGSRLDTGCAGDLNDIPIDILIEQRHQRPLNTEQHDVLIRKLFQFDLRFCNPEPTSSSRLVSS